MTIWFDDRILSPEELRAISLTNMPAHLGMEWVAMGEDWLSMRMPVDARTHQPFGRLHGGASVALAETVGSTAAGLCLDRSKFVGVGMEINANHLRPAYSGWVLATARPEAIGRSTHVWSIRIEDEQNRLACISRLTVAVIPIERK